MIPIALVTCKNFRDLCQDDQLLINPLKSYGFDPYAAVWNDQSVRWDKYQALIVRSSWDYHKSIEKFYAWLDKIENLKIPVWNPIEVIRWNIDKTLYLKDLAKKGLPVIPTASFPKRSEVQLIDVMVKQNWETVIIKPRFGGSGTGIFKADRNDADNQQKKFEELLQNNDILIQPYMKEIQEGEYSFIFFNGVFSHAVLKKPKPGEYRVNYDFGGSWTKLSASENFIVQAKRIITAVKTSLLYARIDMFNINGRLILNELELSDPMLFLKWHPASDVTFASVFRDFMDKSCIP